MIWDDEIGGWEEKGLPKNCSTQKIPLTDGSGILHIQHDQAGSSSSISISCSSWVLTKPIDMPSTTWPTNAHMIMTTFKDFRHKSHYYVFTPCRKREQYHLILSLTQLLERGVFLYITITTTVVVAFKVKSASFARNLSPPWDCNVVLLDSRKHSKLASFTNFKGQSNSCEVARLSKFTAVENPPNYDTVNNARNATFFRRTTNWKKNVSKWKSSILVGREIVPDKRPLVHKPLFFVTTTLGSSWKLSSIWLPFPANEKF